MDCQTQEVRMVRKYSSLISCMRRDLFERRGVGGRGKVAICACSVQASTLSSRS